MHHPAGEVPVEANKVRQFPGLEQALLFWANSAKAASIVYARRASSSMIRVRPARCAPPPFTTTPPAGSRPKSRARCQCQTQSSPGLQQRTAGKQVPGRRLTRGGTPVGVQQKGRLPTGDGADSRHHRNRVGRHIVSVLYAKARVAEVLLAADTLEHGQESVVRPTANRSNPRRGSRLPFAISRHTRRFGPPRPAGFAKTAGISAGTGETGRTRRGGCGTIGLVRRRFESQAG